MLRTEHIYDAYNRLSKQKWVLGNKRYSEAFAYSDGASGDGSLTSMTTGTGDTLSFGYDALKRLQTVTAKSGSSTLFTTAYAYCDISAARTTPQVEFRNVRMGGTILEGKKYVYDELGNITEIRQSTGSHKLLAAYKYDVQGQLERELYYDGIGEATANITTACHYTYDSAGNLLKVEKGAPNSAGVLVITSEQTYTYGDSDWNDLLTAVNGERILYDGAGNPTSYRRGDSLTYDMSWSDGRRLSRLSCYEEQWQIAYTYDADGIRTSKNVDGCLHSYVTRSGKVVRETIGSGSSAMILDFIYDESGRPFALNYSTDGGSSFTTYYYILNLQGDVVKLIRYIPGFEYEEVASYEYDAWGNLLSKSGRMAEKNPLRYRGYYYDNETGFYYLQSRYYDPTLRRFLNADSYTSTGQGFIGTNTFAYSLNNPVNRIDSGGTISIWAYLFFYSEYGWIHLHVQLRILAKGGGAYGMEKGVYNSSGEFVGRVDVYKEIGETAYAWELKTKNAGESAAREQLERYLGNSLKNGAELIKGPAGEFKGRFVVNYLFSSYLVTYSTPSAGVIIYDVDEISYQEQYDYVYVPKKVAQKAEEASAAKGGAAATVITTAAISGAFVCGWLVYGSSNPLGYRTMHFN